MSSHRGSPVVDKEKKYDRQLRLWGDHGQAALEGAKICLINAGALGTEILKNLCLPGVGAFTIVDGKRVTGEDVGNNFFLERSSIGCSRGQAAMELLTEMNSDVKGDYIEETADQILETNPQLFKSFSMVIATELLERTLLDLDKLLWEHNVPLLVCRSYGMLGYMRLVIQEHRVVESHPDNAFEDLRLDRPFPGLVEIADKFDLDKMTKQEHMHTPYLILLYKFLCKWKDEHSDQLPKNYKEKNLFKDTLRSGVLTNEEGVPLLEENFDEAVTATNAALVPSRIPSTVQEIFNDPCCSNLTSQSHNFWILAHAMKLFTENEGAGTLPLRGSIPDMTADSKRYILLQNVYLDQARQDSATVSGYVQQLLTSLGKPTDSISETDIRMFCKNASFLQILRCRSLADEHNNDKAKVSDIGMNLENPDSEMAIYVLLRAVDKFHSQYNRFPGEYDNEREADVHKLTSCVSNIIHDWGLHTTIKEELVQEMCRYGAAELHSVAAFLGGCAAQEVIKVVTNQFVPFNNTFIYNAATGASATYQL
ncbi:NEDD8-activating enzyme E1 regulatory subunit-like [Apostichopus japonicus]|uniref:NEDD8-activating enzyme E1 regulatory subunit-like n=1 Tax=Stichopus japonicus TaxID=307972 RepID=UPI003AB5311D